MSEPITAPESAAPAAEATPESVGQEHVRRVEEKHRVKAPVDSPPAATAEAVTPPEPARPSAADIHPRFEERVSRRSQIKKLEAQNQEYAALFRELAEAAGQPPGPAAPALPEPTPELFKENPQLWYEARTAKIEAALANKLQPVLDYIQQQQGMTQEQQAQNQRLQAQRDFFVERAGLMKEAEADYGTTVEGQGYQERFQKFSEQRFARYKAAGHEDKVAAALVFRELDSHVNI